MNSEGKRISPFLAVRRKVPYDLLSLFLSLRLLLPLSRSYLERRSGKEEHIFFPLLPTFPLSPHCVQIMHMLPTSPVWRDP